MAIILWTYLIILMFIMVFQICFFCDKVDLLFMLDLNLEIIFLK